MPSRDHAALLLRKAGADEFTVEKLIPDLRSSDEVIGFHAQQAIEKLLKAVLTSAGIEYPHTHSLGRLIDLLRANGLLFPDELDRVTELSPFVAAFRYDERPEDVSARRGRRGPSPGG
jgi:HEPN domain-containing protein